MNNFFFLSVLALFCKNEKTKKQKQNKKKNENLQKT